MKLREVGLLTDDKSTLEMLEFGQADKIFKDGLLHERVAYKENDTIKENPEITLADIQNEEGEDTWIHPLEQMEVHAVIHSRLIFGAEYTRLKPNQQEVINAHAMKTVEQLQAAQEAAQMKELEMAERAKLIAKKPIDERTPMG